MDNGSVVTLFTLSGLNFTTTQRITLFLITLLWYVMILFGNIVIIVVIVVDRNLHEPMYIFVCNLCVSALYGTVGFYPKFLLDLLTSHVISYAGCMLQGFIIHSWLCNDFSIIALMAFDRYVAICRPLIYHTVVTKYLSILLLFSWVIPLWCMSMNTYTLLGISLCGSHIKKVYCVNWMIAVLACSPTRANTVVGYVNIFIYFLHFVFILWSYKCLIKVSITSTENWAKFMQTCLPHLISLIVFTIAVLLDLMYMRFGPDNVSQDVNNFMAMEFLLVVPLVNPLVYGFKLSKIRNSILDKVIKRYNKKNVISCNLSS